MQTHSTIQPILSGDFKLISEVNNASVFNEFESNSLVIQKELIDAFWQAIEDSRWQEDPLNLMWMFSARQWRYKLADLLLLLSIWIDTD